MANVRIALDAMGGDDAPAAMVAGAVDYVQANPRPHRGVGRSRRSFNALLQEHGGGWPRERLVCNMPLKWLAWMRKLRR